MVVCGGGNDVNERGRTDILPEVIKLVVVVDRGNDASHEMQLKSRIFEMGIITYVKVTALAVRRVHYCSSRESQFSNLPGTRQDCAHRHGFTPCLMAPLHSTAMCAAARPGMQAFALRSTLPLVVLPSSSRGGCTGSGSRASLPYLVTAPRHSGR